MAVTLVGPPAVARNINGRLELFALGDTLSHIWQTSPGGSWSNWLSLGSPPSGRLTSPPAVAPSADGRLELFAVADDYTLSHIWQTSPGGSWSNWLSHGSPATFQPELIFLTAALAPSADGRLELFLAEPDGNLYHIWQTSPSGSWSSWLSHGRPPSGMLSGTPALAPSADGRLELFISGDDGNLYHIWQTSPSGTWSNWLSHGQPPSTSLVGTPVLARNADGRLELFVLGSDLNYLCYLYHIWQTSPNGTWSNWDSLGQPSSSFRGGALALAPNVDGRLELFAIGGGTLYHIWQTSPGGSWSNWDSIGESSSIPPGVSTLTLATNADGRLELFSMQPAGGALSGNPNAYHIWQTSPGGSWSNWDSLGHP